MKRILSIILIVTAMAGGVSCTRKGEWRRNSGAVWATQYNITYYSDRDLSDSIQEVFRTVEMSLSPFNPQSRISRINRGETDSADVLTERVMAISQDINRASRGAFDPTVSPLVNLWGFGYTGHPSDGRLPSPSQAQIDSALMGVGIGDCSISGGKIAKKSPATTFNFSAVTKGLGCDLMGEMLRRNGCTDYMVEIGGEMALSGHNPRGGEWRVQIDAPVPDNTGMHRAMCVAEFTDCGIATSGNYRNFLTDTAGVRRGHTISPVTGRPVQTPLVSVTVVAPDCAEADAIATACMVSDPSAAEALVRGRKGIRALLVTAEADSLRLIPIRFPKLQ